MAEGELGQEPFEGIRPEDVRIDDLGRVVITSPSVVDRVRAATELKPDLEAARKDTNIICCGNGSCRGGDDLGALVERFTQGGLPE